MSELSIDYVPVENIIHRDKFLIKMLQKINLEIIYTDIG